MIQKYFSLRVDDWKKNIRVNPTSGKNEYLFSIIHSKLKDIIKSPTSWSSVRSCLEVMIELYSNVCFNLLVHSVETSPKTHKVCYMHSYNKQNALLSLPLDTHTITHSTESTLIYMVLFWFMISYLWNIWKCKIYELCPYQAIQWMKHRNFRPQDRKNVNRCIT